MASNVEIWRGYEHIKDEPWANMQSLGVVGGLDDLGLTRFVLKSFGQSVRVRLSVLPTPLVLP